MKIKKNTISGQMLQIVSAHARTCILFALLWAVGVGIWMTKAGTIVFAVLGTIAYVLTLFTESGKIAQYDKKPYSGMTPKPLKGAMLPAILLILNLIVVVIYKISWSYGSNAQYITSGGAFAGNLVSMIWFSMYHSFLGMKNGGMGAVAIIMIFVMPIVMCALGYYAGYKDFDISDKVMKLVYEKKKSV